MRMRVRGMLVALIGLLMASCIPKVQQPEVRVAGARLASLGLSGGVVDVRMSVYNPNRFGLRASGLTYDLDFESPDTGEWFDFTEGRLEERLEVGGGETTVVVIPVEFTYRGLGEVMRGLLDRGTFEYRVSGLVAVEGPVERDIRYRHTGTVTPTGVR